MTGIIWQVLSVSVDCPRRYKVSEKMVPDGLLSVLQISDVKESDFATYNCSAYNAYDSTYLPINFSEKGTSFGFLLAALVRYACLLTYVTFSTTVILC